MKKAIPTIFILILIGVLGYRFGRPYLEHFAYTDERADMNAYFGVTDEDDFPVVLDRAISELHARRFDGACYLNLEDVRSLLNSRFYYDASEDCVYYCTPDDRLIFPEGSAAWKSDKGEAGEAEAPIMVREEETVWLSLSWLEDYADFAWEAYENPNRLHLTLTWDPVLATSSAEDTNIRVSGGIKSEISGDISKGDHLVLLEQMDKWSKVMTDDCLFGYVENKRLTESHEETPEPVTGYQEPEFKSLVYDGTINMAWHNVTVVEGNVTYDDYMPRTKKVGIVSPTWFRVTDDEGSVNCIASVDYVMKAHENGLQVWAVFDNFSTGELYGAFLSSNASRQKVIEALINGAVQYNLDGINIDIESISSERGEDYIEFIRELSIRTHEQGIILSVDNYVPYNFNDYYHLDEQGRFADYVVIMGYDEHYSGGGEAGSVASIGYVEYGITEALKEVPAEKLVNGLPFYTQIWTTNADGVIGKPVGMKEAADFMEAHGMVRQWNEEAGQYYAETAEGNTYYQIWLEDKESIDRKLSVMEQYHLAGAAEWSLGLETADVWDVIADYVERQ